MTVARIGKGARGRPGGAVSLQTSDLTFLGQVEATGLYSRQNLAMRYVGGERRFLAYEFFQGTGPQGSEWIGDLVEYRVSAALKNGGSDWILSNVPGWSEVRRWSNWTTIARMKTAGTYSAQWRESPYFANGVKPAGFYWDERSGCLWYTLVPEYPGSEIIWPPWNAVALADSEAWVSGGTQVDVSNGNIYGPYYVRDSAVTDDWKDAASGIIPIDSSRQAAMGGKFIAVGHHMANIGSKGSRSIGMWVVSDLPVPPPATNAILWPTAVHLYDTSWNSGKSAPNVHKPNISKNAAYHGNNNADDNFVHAGVAVAANDGDPVGLNVGDCIYVSETPYAYIDTICVFMNSAAAGGTYVPEIFNGSAWVQPSGWAVSVGAADLSAAENVFYWPKVTFSPSADAGLSSDYWVRLRRTVAGTSGGSYAATMASISMNGIAQPDILPLPGSGNVGGYVRPGSGTPQYDASHYGYQFVEPMYGGAWVKTANCEGLAYFGAIGGGGYAYTGVPIYAQPDAGGTPIKYECASLPAIDASTQSGGFDWSNGPRWETPLVPNFMPFSVSDLQAAAADPTKRFSTFLNPVSYASLYDTFTGLIPTQFVTNPRVSAEPYYGAPRVFQYYVGQSVIWDATTGELIVLIPTYNQRNILAFFQVR